MLNEIRQTENLAVFWANRNFSSVWKFICYLQHTSVEKSGLADRKAHWFSPIRSTGKPNKTAPGVWMGRGMRAGSSGCWLSLTDCIHGRWQVLQIATPKIILCILFLLILSWSDLSLRCLNRSQCGATRKINKLSYNSYPETYDLILSYKQTPQCISHIRLRLRLHTQTESQSR